MAYRGSEKERVRKAAYNATYHVTHRAAIRTRKATRGAVNYRDPEKWPHLACQRLRLKAQKLGIKFDMRPEDIQIPTMCPFTLLPFIFGAYNPQSPSVDRIKPDQGYVRGNVRVISLRANIAKSDITDPAIFDRLAADARLWSLV